LFLSEDRYPQQYCIQDSLNEPETKALFEENIPFFLFREGIASGTIIQGELFYCNGVALVTGVKADAPGVM
jgi:hypothetical protein